MSNPLELFRQWYTVARAATPLKHPGAVCVSTVDCHGVPDARFVDLKAVTDTGFVFCTHLDSPKGQALTSNPAVALTFWWDHVERQVRVVGRSTLLADAEANQFWQERSRDAQLISWAAQQSAVLDTLATLEERLSHLREQFAHESVPRPAQWGGYCVVPARIEFLTFQASRLHERLLFSWDGTTWQQHWLQP